MFFLVASVKPTGTPMQSTTAAKWITFADPWHWRHWGSGGSGMGVYPQGYGAALSTSMKLWNLGRRCFVPEAWFVHFNASPNVFVIFIWSMWKALWQMVVGWNCACVSRKHWIYLGLLRIPWFVHTAWVCGHVHHFLELHLCHRLAGVDGRARFRSFRLCLDRKKLSSIQPACGKHSDDVRAGLTGGGLDIRNPLEGWGWKVPWLVCATCRLQQQSRSNSRFFSSRASIQRCSFFQQRAYPLDESMVSTASSGLFSLEAVYMAK